MATRLEPRCVAGQRNGGWLINRHFRARPPLSSYPSRIRDRDGLNLPPICEWPRIPRRFRRGFPLVCPPHEFIEFLDRGSRPGEDPRLHGGVDAFTEVVNPGCHNEHNCHDREYRQQVAVPLEVSTLDVKMHGLPPCGKYRPILLFVSRACKWIFTWSMPIPSFGGARGRVPAWLKPLTGSWLRGPPG
jgi:hypothetical protein